MILVDSNVLLDLFTEDSEWFNWSARILAEAADSARVAINPVVYGEVSVRFSSMEELDDLLAGVGVHRDPIPYEAAFLAAKVFREYRRRGGVRRSPLPDFYIGAHAAVSGYRLLTRDAGQYRTYFPGLSIIAPD